MGTRCEEVCPEGFFGSHCMNTCNCPNLNFACHPALGCVCKSGFRGSNCNVAATDQRIGEVPESKWKLRKIY
jgi:hypothetical protein